MADALHTTQRMQPVPFQPMEGRALDNFTSHIKTPEDDIDGCWLWTAAKTGKGYGRVKLNKKLHSPHRLAYAQWVGEVPAGMYVCHHCDTPGCVNPKHLFLGTCSDNMKDCRDKGRLPMVDDDRFRTGRGKRKAVQQ